ncbi:STAS domain-containing protein [Pseudooceanicola sp. C21-150M6]|uniref:STAS domain-containing protein n=1 Tax=Pseudooceanicola sp. C21-150M6 TaxID=3434355 RepID=UPI003D7FF152
MKLAVEEIGNVQASMMVVRIDASRIDAAAAIQFKDAMRDIAEDGTGLVLLDLSEVEFIDSSGLGAIVAVMKFLAPLRRLELAGLQPNVARVFRLTRMDSVFAIHPEVETAMASHAG